MSSTLTPTEELGVQLMGVLAALRRKAKGEEMRAYPRRFWGRLGCAFIGNHHFVATWGTDLDTGERICLWLSWSLWQCQTYGFAPDYEVCGYCGVRRTSKGRWS